MAGQEHVGSGDTKAEVGLRARAGRTEKGPQLRLRGAWICPLDSRGPQGFQAGRSHESEGEYKNQEVEAKRQNAGEKRNAEEVL